MRGQDFPFDDATFWALALIGLIAVLIWLTKGGKS
jgi:hypothetical protein